MTKDVKGRMAARFLTTQRGGVSGGAGEVPGKAAKYSRNDIVFRSFGCASHLVTRHYMFVPIDFLVSTNTGKITFKVPRA